MSAKATVARALITASEELCKVNLLVDLKPRPYVAVALRESMKAFELLRRGKFREASKLKSSIQAVAAIDRALKQNRLTMEGDQELLMRAAKTFAEVGSSFSSDTPVPAAVTAPPVTERKPKKVLKSFQDIDHAVVPVKPPSPAMPPAVGSADDLNVGDLDNVMQTVSAAAGQLKKLPKSVSDGKWTVQRAPILVYSHTFIPDVSFTRLGIDRDKYIKIGQALTFKRKGATQHGYLLQDQLVVGFDKDDALFDVSRKASIKNKRERGVDSSLLMRRKVDKREGLITRAINAISARLGSHFNVLSERDPPYIVLSGSSLVWVWLLPSRAGNDFAPKVADASFPKLSAENFEVKQRNLRALRRELDDLEAMRAVLAKRKEVLDSDKMARYLELHRILHTEENKAEPSPEEKREKLADLRKQLEAEVQQKFAKQLGQIEDLQEQITEISDSAPDGKARRLAARRQLKALEDEVARGRDVLARKYRSMMK